MKAKQYIQSSIVLLGLSSVMVGCVREEKPAIPIDKRKTSSVDLGQNYTTQMYFDLETNTIVGANARQGWSLAFESAPDGFHVFTNTGKNMLVYPTTSTDFAAVKYSDRGEEKWDRSSGNVDSTAIGDWRTDGYVYIIDEGVDDNDVKLGISKIQILSVDDKRYKIRVSKINNSHDVVLDVPKDTTYNLSFVLLGEDPKVVMIEPPKDTWDLVFTRYGFTFYDPYVCYMVVGCLQNRCNTIVAQDSAVGLFREMTLEKAKQYTFSKDIDVIGYDWKTVGSTTGGGTDYTVDTNKLYIIKTAQDHYFKLRFVSFYNENKIKGAPKWEYEQLK